MHVGARRGLVPLSVCAGWLQVVESTPHHQATALVRGSNLGVSDWAMLNHGEHLASSGGRRPGDP